MTLNQIIASSKADSLKTNEKLERCFVRLIYVPYTSDISVHWKIAKKWLAFHENTQKLAVAYFSGKTEFIITSLLADAIR